MSACLLYFIWHDAQSQCSHPSEHKIKVKKTISRELSTSQPMGSRVSTPMSWRSEVVTIHGTFLSRSLYELYAKDCTTCAKLFFSLACCFSRILKCPNRSLRFLTLYFVSQGHCRTRRFYVLLEYTLPRRPWGPRMGFATSLSWTTSTAMTWAPSLTVQNLCCGGFYVWPARTTRTPNTE